MKNVSSKPLKKKKGLAHLKYAGWDAYLWLAPSLILIAIFILAPVVETMYLSFCDVSKAGIVRKAGTLDNYKFVVSQTVFGRVMLNTILWDIIIVSVSMVLSIILALVLNEKFHGRKIVRTVLLLPWATSELITACAWKYIFDYNYGALNTLLMKAGLISTPINWLGEVNSAFACMIFVGIIVTIPFMTFTLLSGLTSISPDYYEAAKIDGANFWQRLTNVTLPLLKPAIDVSIVLNVIYVFNSFVIIHQMTDGAPAQQTSTIMTYLFYLAFRTNKMGPAAAISMIGFVVLLIFAVLYMKYQMKEETS